MTALLPLALLFELLALVTRLQPLSVMSGVLLALFFSWHWRSLMPYPRRLGMVTLAVLGYWLVTGEANWQQAARMLSSAAYYAAFIGALGLMHCLVKRLKQLSELHRLLLSGPRAWLYPGYLMSTFAISSVLSFGMLNLICGSLESHLGRRPYSDSQCREGRRGVMVTALRGFALVPLLAPTSVAVAILTRELPGLTWSTLLPFGLLGGLILLLFGWPTENRRLQQLIDHSPAKPGAGSPQASGSLRGLLIGSLIGIALIALLAALTWLSATQAAMLLVPIAVIVILLWQRIAPPQVFSEVSETLIGMRNETFIFASSALLAGLVAAVLPVHHLADQLGNTPLALFALGTFGALAVMALALLGVAPLISLNLCAALLAQLASQGLPIMQPAVALLFGFSLAMLLSPYGPSALLLARHAQLSPWRIAVGWNGRFVLSVLLPLLLVPLLA
ncbi:hypothetical protein CH92_02075 [Stutzerimonas stutzeri]|uniref:Uncharacterized protein n=1 Tax=Stutzerimonas stutzeri TaxID=316 RepID=W8R6K8_STUST|nr:hypothetical protein [Stutzerimonas stutzeri]AHL73947.1 hypothetical protein CH92_02075 [Stutzerimonas stutzeri]MCQ4328531.1 hypothetical protein [Stutzerimonas stutzeri]